MVIGYQKWRSLLFVHWSLPHAAVQRLVPRPLEVETFDGHAIVGLVPFTMHGVRARGLPPIPTMRAFHETNLRTYVRFGRDKPGIYFFSLDAGSSLAVAGARALTPLPYFRATMRMERHGDRVDYASTRVSSGPRADLALQWAMGEPLGVALPGTFEHFVVERYALYCETPRGALYKTEVRHSPYPLRRAKVEHLEESLLHAAGIQRPAQPPSVLFSEGVDVSIVAPVRVFKARTDRAEPSPAARRSA